MTMAVVSQSVMPELKVETLLVSKPPPHFPGARVYSDPDIGIPGI